MEPSSRTVLRQPLVQLAEDLAVVDHAPGLEVGARERATRDELHAGPEPEHGVDALRHRLLERGEIPLLLNLRRGLDAQQQLVHPAAAAADDDPVLAAIALHLVERR